MKVDDTLVKFITLGVCQTASNREDGGLSTQNLMTVHCFACRIFLNSDNASASAFTSKGGTDDWQHLSVILKSHEMNKVHRQCMIKWFDLEKGLKNQKTIDCETEVQIRSEAQRWRDITGRLLAVVQFLASHNLAFRGHKETIFSDPDDTERSGIFIDLINSYRGSGLKFIPR